MSKSNDPAPTPMPAWLPRAIAVALALTAVFEMTVWAARQLVGLGVLLLVSFFLSMVMEPAVSRLQARGMGRAAATLLVFVVTAASLAGFAAAVLTLLINQTAEVSHRLPTLLTTLTGRINDAFGTTLAADRLTDDTGTVETYARQAADHLWGLSTSVVGGVLDLLTVALFAFYFTADGPRLRRTALSLLPPQRQPAAHRAWTVALAKTGGYMYSRALLALFSTLAHAVAFMVLGVPYPVALGIWVGVVSQFVPTVGTYVAAALPTLVALTVEPMDALWVIVFATAYQQVENYALQPRITARTVDVHPAVAFGSVLAGAALLGAVGAIIAIPTTATLQALATAYLPRYKVAPALDSTNKPPHRPM